MRLKSLTIEEFRGLRSLTLDRLGDINLIVGDNNVGKTSVLEAIALLEKPDDINVILRNCRLRPDIAGSSMLRRGRVTPFQSFKGVFPEYGTGEPRVKIAYTTGRTKQEMLIKGQFETTLRGVLELQPYDFSIVKQKREDRHEMEGFEVEAFSGSLIFTKQVGNKPSIVEEQKIELYEGQSVRIKSYAGPRIIYTSPIDHLTKQNISTKMMLEQKESVLELLRMADDRIIDYGAVREDASYSMIQNYAEMLTLEGIGLVPLYTFGDGLKKILMLVNAVMQAKGGILLLDEIETSIHTSLLQTVYRWLIEACRKYNVQIFATTHSLEAVAALAQCAAQNPAVLNCYKIERSRERFVAKYYSEGSLYDFVNLHGMDVR